MRSEIKLFEDQYRFFKDMKSKRLLVAFVEFMFEDIEPTDLKGLEKTVFESMRKRMENSKKIHDGNSKGGSNSRGGGRPQNTNGELEGENKSKTSQQTTQKQLKNNEEGSMKYIITSKDVIVEESTEQKSDNEMLYESYPFKGKGIDKQVCDKLIAKQLEQGATIKGMLKEMELEKLELRINQGLSYRYGKKFETWIKEYVEGMADSEDRLRKLLTEHRKRLENGPNYKKNPRDEICDLFGADYVKKLFMETKQGIKLFTT